MTISKTCEVLSVKPIKIAGYHYELEVEFKTKNLIQTLKSFIFRKDYHNHYTLKVLSTNGIYFYYVYDDTLVEIMPYNKFYELFESSVRSYKYKVAVKLDKLRD